MFDKNSIQTSFKGFTARQIKENGLPGYKLFFETDNFISLRCLLTRDVIRVRFDDVEQEFQQVQDVVSQKNEQVQVKSFVRFIVFSCNNCPFVRTRKDYCLANEFLGLKTQYLWVNSHFIAETLHPDCPLQARYLVLSSVDMASCESEQLHVSSFAADFEETKSVQVECLVKPICDYCGSNLVFSKPAYCSRCWSVRLSQFKSLYFVPFGFGKFFGNLIQKVKQLNSRFSFLTVV